MILIIKRSRPSAVLLLFLAVGAIIRANEAAKPLVLEKSGAERQLPERLLGASAEALIEQNGTEQIRLFSPVDLSGGKKLQRIQTLAASDLTALSGPNAPADIQPETDGAIRLPAWSLTRILRK